MRHEARSVRRFPLELVRRFQKQHRVCFEEVRQRLRDVLVPIARGPCGLGSVIERFAEATAVLAAVAKATETESYFVVVLGDDANAWVTERAAEFVRSLT